MDQQIVDLFFDRSESAIAQAEQEYGAYCFQIAYNILGDREDAAECVNDTWLSLWNAIPPNRPRNFRAYAGRIVRNLALTCLERKSRQKRGGGQAELVLSELENILPAGGDVADDLEREELARAINRYLSELGPESRAAFVGRYFYFESIGNIAKRMGARESKVKSLLFRARKGLRSFLEKEGVQL